jgi:outer membrane protein, adhesin transport system
MLTRGIFLKMLFRFLSPLLLSALLGAQPLHDQHTLESLIDATLKNHPSIRSSQQMITGAQAGVEGAKWGYFPTPSVELSQNSGRTSMSARLDQPLWTGGKLDAAVTAAEARKAESVIYLDETSYQLVSTLITLFRTYFHATESLKVLLEGKEQLLELQEMLQRRIAAGASSLSDGELIRSRLSQIDTELTAARINRSSALQQIEVLSGLTLDPDAEVRSAPLELSDESFETIILEMRASHPSLKKLDAQIQSAHAERDRAKAVLWPNLSLGQNTETVRSTLTKNRPTTSSMSH